MTVLIVVAFFSSKKKVRKFIAKQIAWISNTCPKTNTSFFECTRSLPRFTYSKTLFVCIFLQPNFFLSNDMSIWSVQDLF